MKEKRRIRILGILAVTAGICLAACFGAAAEEARNIAAECKYKVEKGSFKNTKVMFDGAYNTYWRSATGKTNHLEVELPEGETCSGVQIKWGRINRSWSIEVQENGEWVPAGEDESGYMVGWMPLENVTKFRITSHNKTANIMEIRELEVYSAGERPAKVQVWQPTAEKADLLVVIAHPDDEYVFLGGVIPTYGAERGKNVLVCYITESTRIRRLELLDGLWTAGQRTYPLLGKFHDRYTFDLEEAYKRDTKKKLQNYMIEIFRHYRPEVVVTHDIQGEYGHGMHKVCADIVINALEKAADAGAGKESAEKYGTWDVPKCYIHLYEKDQIRFDWKGMKLDAFGGKSAFEIADAAWQCHVSQAQKGKYEVYLDDSKYDSQVFGLYRSKVGPDVKHDDFFENLPEATGE